MSILVSDADATEQPEELWNTLLQLIVLCSALCQYFPKAFTEKKYIFCSAFCQCQQGTSLRCQKPGTDSFYYLLLCSSSYTRFTVCHYIHHLAYKSFSLITFISLNNLSLVVSGLWYHKSNTTVWRHACRTLMMPNWFKSTVCCISINHRRSQLMPLETNKLLLWTWLCSRWLLSYTVPLIACLSMTCLKPTHSCHRLSL